MEASGKLHIEPGKGRKCVILIGRPREVYKMSWNNLRNSGGVGEVEFWSKLSPEGMVLSATSNVQNVLGFSTTEMGKFDLYSTGRSRKLIDLVCLVGTSLFQLVKSEYVPEIRAALVTCAEGKAISVRYKTKTRRGYVDVVTSKVLHFFTKFRFVDIDAIFTLGFYPREVNSLDDDFNMPAMPILNTAPTHVSIM